MPGKSSKLGQFWQELKRRKVIRRNMVYAASGFVILELVSIIAEPFGLPDWTLKLVFILLCIGFIISLILSWFYNFTPDGLERIKTSDEADYSPEEKPSQLLAWKIATYFSVIIIAGFLVFNIFRGEKQSGDLTGLKKSIAVLPFENMSINDEHSYIGDAMTDEIIMQLKYIKEFHVISRTSTLKYKDSKITLPDIGQELNVNYLVEGTVQRQDDNIRIRVQVSRAENEDHIWSETYDKEWKDIFSIQSDVAQQIAYELKTILSPEEIQQIDKRPTDNLEAYDMYLQGRYFWNRRTKEDIEEAIAYFSKAIEKDTNYALAYVGLADCYSIGAAYGYISSKDAVQDQFQKAKEAAVKALEIDNTLAEAYTSLAFVNLESDWDWKGSKRNFERAIQLNPGYETAHHWYAIWFSIFKRFDEGIAEARLARELDPLSPIINSAVVRRLYHARRYEQAIEEALKVITLFPDFFLIHQFLGMTYLQKGMFSEAIFELHKAVRYSGDNIFARAYLGHVYGITGDQSKAKVILNDLLIASEDTYVSAVTLASVYIGLGNHDKAIEWLEKAYDEHSARLIYINISPVYDPLRTDPRFIELLKKMNLE